MAIIERSTYDYHYMAYKVDKRKYFEVDELIAEPISLLNKKGYKTKYCCSGHEGDSIIQAFTIGTDEEIKNNLPGTFEIGQERADGYREVFLKQTVATCSYIVFSKDFFKGSKLPYGWHRDSKANGELYISYNYDESLTGYNFYTVRLKVMKNLLKWVKNLPSIV